MSLWHVARRFFFGLALSETFWSFQRCSRVCVYVAWGRLIDHVVCVAWLCYKNVSPGPLDREANSLEGERTSPDAFSPWALKTVAKTDARCLPQGAPPTSPSTLTDMTKKRDSGRAEQHTPRVPA